MAITLWVGGGDGGQCPIKRAEDNMIKQIVS